MKKAWHQKFRRASKAERTNPAGITFDSKGEMKRWHDLQLLQLAKKIRNLRRQVKFELVLPDGTPIVGKSGRTLVYTADFVYEEGVIIPNIPDYEHTRSYEWREVVEDFKGYASKEAQLRIAVFQAIYKKTVRITK